MKAYLIIIAVAALVLGGLVYFTGGRDASQSVVVLYQTQPPLTQRSTPTAVDSKPTQGALSDVIASTADSSRTVNAPAANRQGLIASTGAAGSGSQGAEVMTQMSDAIASLPKSDSGALSSLVKSEFSNKSLGELISMNPLLSDADKQELLSSISSLQAIADEVRAEGNHVPSSPKEALTDIMYMYRNLDQVVEQGSWNPETRNKKPAPTPSNEAKPKQTYKPGSLNDPNLTRMRIDTK